MESWGSFMNKEVECSLRFKENSFGKKGFYINFQLQYRDITLESINETFDVVYFVLKIANNGRKLEN